jgi:proteasome lid subunit RPN8/RPN11
MGKSLRIEESAYRKVIQHAQAAWPLECCGALLGTRRDGLPRVLEALPTLCPETQTTPDRFRISGQDMVRFQAQAGQMQQEILGFYHSHPARNTSLQTDANPTGQLDAPPTPSRADLEGAMWTDCFTMIVRVTEDGRSAVGCYWLTGDSLATRALVAVPLEPAWPSIELLE